jgi:uncharacterized membrane protein (UPF0127 family)
LLLVGCVSTHAIVESPFPVTGVEISGTELTVWVADGPSERSQGLRGVETLPAGIDGMLFVYRTPARVRYGMLDTPIPLDIWFFDVSGTLIGTSEMEPCPESPCPAYASPGEIGWVLETPLGEQEFTTFATISTVESG